MHRCHPRLVVGLTLELALALAHASCIPFHEGSTDQTLSSSTSTENTGQDHSAACGNGRLDSEEDCDPSVEGRHNETWHCSPNCQAREIYTPCDDLGSACASSATQDDSPTSVCGSTVDSQHGMCTPLSGLSLDETMVARDACPAIDGPYTQKRFNNVHCVIECDADADTNDEDGGVFLRCPRQIPRCVDNPFKHAGPYEATRFCSPQF